MTLTQPQFPRLGSKHMRNMGKRNAPFDPGRIRTCNLLIRSQTRYPLRHWARATTTKRGTEANMPVSVV